MIGGEGMTAKRPKIGTIIRSWERGRHDRLASRGSHPQATGILYAWYRAGYRFTQRQLERGEILQLRIDFDRAPCTAEGDAEPATH